MNKKAFTLIEILAVIVIIALILVLVTPNILANLSKARGKVSDATEKIIEEAVDLYIDENPDVYPENEGDIYCITVDTLMGAGKLVNPLTDAATGKEISGSTSVRVTITKGGREFELVTDGTCDQGNLDILTSKDIGLAVSNITTKGFDVITTIPDKYKNNIDKYDYSIDNGKKYDYTNKGSNTRITNLLTNTYTVKVKVTTKDGQVVVGSKAVKATLVPIGDITFSSAPSMNVCAASKVVTVTNPASSQIAINKNEKLMYSYTTNTALNKNSWTKQSSNKYNITVTENGTLMARVTDGVNEKIVSYAITKVDNPNPVILKATVDLTSEKYWAGRITVTARTSVCTNSSKVQINGYCLTTSNRRPSKNDSCFNNTGNSNYGYNRGNSFGRDNGTYYAWVRDTAGNVSLKGVKVTINWKGTPSCSIKVTGGTKGNNGWYRSNVKTGWNKVNTAGKTERSKSLSPTSITSNGTTTSYGKIYAGGKSASCSLKVKLDKTSPTCSVKPQNNYSSNPSAKFTCSDKTSGCKSSGTVKYGDGWKSYTCYDYAGNKSTASVKLTVVYPPTPSGGGGSGSGSGGNSGGSSKTDSISISCSKNSSSATSTNKVTCSVKSSSGSSDIKWDPCYASWGSCSDNSKTCTITAYSGSCCVTANKGKASSQSCVKFY